MRPNPWRGTPPRALPDFVVVVSLLPFLPIFWGETTNVRGDSGPAPFLWERGWVRQSRGTPRDPKTR